MANKKPELTDEWLKWATACKGLEDEMKASALLSGAYIKASREYSEIITKEPTPMYKGGEDGINRNDSSNGDSDVLQPSVDKVEAGKSEDS